MAESQVGILVVVGSIPTHSSIKVRNSKLADICIAMRNGMSTSEAGKLGSIEAAKTIAIKKCKRIDDWNNNPKLCKFCEYPIIYEKRNNDFCNHSCAAAFNNKGIRRWGDAPKNCLNCHIKTYNNKFCSVPCQQNFEWNERKTELITVGVDNSSGNKFAKRYLIELYNNKCQICKLNIWLDLPISLVLDHIDGNPYNNQLVNLRVICNNCDATLPTYKGRNKGNGRFKRAERYKYEKEFLKAKNNEKETI